VKTTSRESSSQETPIFGAPQGADPEKATAVPAVTPSSAVAQYVPDDIDYVPTDYELPPLRRYVSVRQKDLKNESGDVLRKAGRFEFNDPADANAPDKDELLLSVLEIRDGAIYFEEGKRDPVCKSHDGKTGSRPREGSRFGTCSTCSLGQFGLDGSRPLCRPQLHLLCWDVNEQRPLVFTLSWSGEREFHGFHEHMKLKAEREYPKRNGQAPYIFHLYAVPVAVQFIRRGAYEYYVPIFGTEVPLPAELVALTRNARKTLRPEFERAIQEAQDNVENYGAASARE
jgi:hypothetical protein